MPRYAAGIAANLAVIWVCTAAFSAEVASQDVVFSQTGAIDAPLTETKGNAEEGAKIYVDRATGNCVACHAISDRVDADFQGTIGPALDGAGDRWDIAQLRGIVVDAKKTFPESMMPGFYKSSGYVRPGDGFTGAAGTEPLPTILSAQQVEDVVAYLAQLKE